MFSPQQLDRYRVIFTYLELGNARTTSPLEGGINNGIGSVLRNHRGIIKTHMKRAAEWFLTLREIPIDHIHEHITQKPADETIETTKRPEEPIGPALYDTGVSADEGLWARTGWAGRG